MSGVFVWGFVQDVFVWGFMCGDLYPDTKAMMFYLNFEHIQLAQMHF